MSLFWDVMYLFKKTPWDTGITPPEIVAVIESGKVPIGRALDLGCGTGTNAIYLAQHGFTVTAIDVSRRAIALAKRKTRSAQLHRAGAVGARRCDADAALGARRLDRFCLRHRLLSQSQGRGAPTLRLGFVEVCSSPARSTCCTRSSRNPIGLVWRWTKSLRCSIQPISLETGCDAAAIAMGADRHGIL